MLIHLLPDQRVVFEQADWDTYEYLLGVREEYRRRAVRITYDRGRLELMTVSAPHERWKKLLTMFLEFAAVEGGQPMVCCGGATVRRESLRRGCEPDGWYYLGPTAVRMVAVRELDFTRDPPPDLAVEIEVSRSLLDRLGIYAAFGIREVWRFDGERLDVMRLHPDGVYMPYPSSQFFPALPLPELARFLSLGGTVDDGTLVRQFRDWFRQTLTPPAAGPTP
jgi:Uma2 family endonuclease